MSVDAWSNIKKLIDSGKDSTLWRNIKERNYQTCDEMVIDIGVEAKKLIDSGISDSNSGNGSTGSSSVDKPVIPGGGGSLGGGGGAGGSSKPAKPETPKSAFTDIDNVEWAKESINALAEKGILNGKGDNKFAPNDGVTREEFVKIIAVAFDLKADKDVNFADVSEDRWSKDFIKAAASNGIVNGDGENFNPTDIITRQDMAVIIYRVFEKLGAEVKGEAISFNDSSDIADYAQEAVEALSGAGIINGMGDGTFAPRATVTRAQSAKVVYSLLNLLGGGK